VARKEKVPVSIPCFEPFDKGFVPAKPIQMGEYEPEILEQLEKDGLLLKTLKEDGYKLYAVKSHVGWKLFTDGIRDVSAHVPQITNALSKLKVPNNSMLIGEGMIYLDGQKSDLSGPQQIFSMKDPAEAVAKQDKIGKLQLMVFYIAFWDGKSCFDASYCNQVARIETLLRGAGPYIRPVQVLRESLAEVQKSVRKSGAEGLVLYDSEFVSSYRLDGKDPERVAGCYKWKPEFEDDFIAWGHNVSEKNPALVKEVKLTQFEKKTGKFIDCGKYGAFSKSERERLLTASYPMVLKLTFTKRFPSGKLREPKKPIFRTDKPWQKCVTSIDFPRAVYVNILKM